MITQTQYHTGFAHGVLASINEMESNGWAVRQIIPTQKEHLDIASQEVVSSWLVVYEKYPTYPEIDLEREAQHQAVREATERLTKKYRDAIQDLANRDTECPNWETCPWMYGDGGPIGKHMISDHPIIRPGEVIGPIEGGMDIDI